MTLSDRPGDIGFGWQAKVVMAWLIVFLIVFFNTFEGARSVDPDLINTGDKDQAEPLPRHAMERSQRLGHLDRATEIEGNWTRWLAVCSCRPPIAEAEE